MLKEEVNIRKARIEDFDNIISIYHYAQKLMIDDGNKNQWSTTYPTREIIRDHIRSGTLYVGESNGVICFSFAFIIGEDETYKIIEGKWINDEPYGVIHLLASSGKVKNCFYLILNFALSKINNIRIDTHHENKRMLHILEKNNFQYCGIIYVRDKSPRMAFQLLKGK